MTHFLPALPLVVLLGTAATMLLVGSRRIRHVLAWAGSLGFALSAGLLVAAVWSTGPLILGLGGFAAPFGIVLAVDPFSAAMVAVTAVVAVPVLMFAHAWLPAEMEARGFQPLAFFMLAGVVLAFLTGDLFNLYVAFEALLVASFGLMVLGGSRDQLRGAVPYVVINLVASAFFLAGIALLYGLTGTLNLADMAVRVSAIGSQHLVTGAAVLLLMAFGIKAAVFPVFYWLPASYNTPPPPIAALFAGLLTKVGVYALVRVFTLLFSDGFGLLGQILLVVSAFTMILGVLGAAAQSDIRKILSFHIISQIGYMVMGLALMTPLAILGAVFYILHHIVVKTNLFLLGGLIARSAGDYDLDRIGGLYRARPFLAILFLVPALSLAGIPPLSGFWAKLTLIQAGLEAQVYWIVVVAILVGLLTLYSMTKIWAGGFWAPASEEVAHQASGRLSPALLIPVAVLATVTVALGLSPEPVLEFAQRAAEALLDPNPYIDAVLGGGLAE